VQGLRNPEGMQKTKQIREEIMKPIRVPICIWSTSSTNEKGELTFPGKCKEKKCDGYNINCKNYMFYEEQVHNANTL